MSIRAASAAFAGVRQIWLERAEHWEETMQDRMTRGQSKLIRGDPTPAPDLSLYGCDLIPAGTPMNLETENVVPVVTALRPDGSRVRGVTLSAMFARAAN